MRPGRLRECAPGLRRERRRAVRFARGFERRDVCAPDVFVLRRDRARPLERRERLKV